MKNFNPLAARTVQRLSPETRHLAETYLTGGYRPELVEPDFCVEDLALPPETPPVLVHAHVAEALAERAPIHLRPEEKIVCGAPYLPAVRHEVPGMNGRSSISHTTADFGDAITRGLSGLEREIRARMAETPHGEEAVFCDALLHVIHAMRRWTERWRTACRDAAATQTDSAKRANLTALAEILDRVPETPPATFREALQSLWIFFEFQRLCGNWSGLGRFDAMLGPYLERDLAAGRLTLDEARELGAHFWIKGTEWCYGLRQFNPGEPGSGDAQHYQNIILSGIGHDGKNIENPLTFLVLDVIEELHISDYPVAVRLNGQTSPALLRRIAEVELLGGGIVSVYNEDVVISGLRRLGYPEEEIVDFTNDGCWEILIPGKTNFIYSPFDALQLFQDALLAAQPETTFEMLFQDYRKRLRERIAGIKNWLQERRTRPDLQTPPDAVLSLVMPSCRQSARSYTDFGTKYTVNALHAGGLPDVANSFAAIRRYVFEEKRLTLPQLADMLRNDWSDAEPLRLEIANRFPCYGNDDDATDGMLKRVLDDYGQAVEDSPEIPDIRTPAGVSTFGREIQYATKRLATAFGKHAGEYLAPNLSPTPGTEKNALTAVLNSYCKMDFTRTPNGCPLDLRLSAGLRNVPGAADILASLLTVFRERGGFYLQIDSVDPDMLRAAQADPDRFPNLVVRISGWSARFASLSKKWQDMIINRTILEAR